MECRRILLEDHLRLRNAEPHEGSHCKQRLATDGRKDPSLTYMLEKASSKIAALKVDFSDSLLKLTKADEALFCTVVTNKFLNYPIVDCMPENEPTR